MAFIVDLAGIVSGRGPELPFVTCIRSSLLHLSGFLFERGSELQFVTTKSSPEDVSGLVSGLDSEPGSELPFAKHVDQIELRGGLWSRS